MRVIIIGAGGHGHVVADILFKMWTRGQDMELAGFVDNDPALADQVHMGLKVLGRQEELADLSHDAVIVAIGDNAKRKAMYESLAAKGERFITAIHPTAVLAPDVCVGPGAMLCAGVIVNPGARIGANAILNTGCTVDHHCCVGDHAHIAPGVNLAGHVSVGEGALVGIGSCATPGSSIGDWAVLGAGGVLTGSVPDRETWGGIPAKKL